MINQSKHCLYTFLQDNVCYNDLYHAKAALQTTLGFANGMKCFFDRAIFD